MATLRLYPAQSKKARLVKKILSFWVRCFLPLPRSRPPGFDLDWIDWFEPPGFTVDHSLTGIFMGNQSAPGARSLHLLFDSSRQPRFLMKVGFTPAATAKIIAEREFLLAQGGSLPSIPRLLGEIDRLDCHGNLLPYIDGFSPPPDPLSSPLVGMLNSWVSDEIRRIDSFPEWPGFSGFLQLARLGEKVVAPVLAHGDLTPWNILVDSSGRWNVIDWERGRPCGLPLWDWFHYLIQPMILVQKADARTVISALEALFSTEAFQLYARRTRTEGIFHDLLLAYLHHQVEVIRPTEGSDGLQALLSAVK